MNRLGAIVGQRCPVCLRGAVFASWFSSNPECPVCGIHFEREDGYYLNAMFVAYVAAFLVLIPIALVLYLLDASIGLFILTIGAVLIILWPLIFRYSRVLWLHMDQMLDPRPPPSSKPPSST